MTFKHSKKWYFWASWIAKAVGVVLCIAPAFVATLINFPMMVTTNTTSTISIFFVIGILLSLSVVLAKVVKAFKENAMLSVSVALAGVSALFTVGYEMEKSTMQGIATVAMTGAIGIFFGMLCFKLFDIWHNLYEHCGEVYVK